MSAGPWQGTAFQQVEPRPVEAAQRMVEQGRGVGQIGGLMGDAVDQGAESWALSVL